MAENLKRILVPIVGQGSITHIIRTGILDDLKKFCIPVVALLWQQDDLIEELQGQGYEVKIIPSFKASADYLSLRSKVNIWYVHHKLKTPSLGLQERYLKSYIKNNSNQLIKSARKIYYRSRFVIQPSFIKRLLIQENSAMHAEPVFKTYQKWLVDLQVEGLFTVTPFINEVDLMARICKERGIPVIASIHSFDNVTKRGWQSVLFDHYIVWNKYNKSELERIHPSLKHGNKITIAGAPQFDFHFNPAFWWSRDEWMKRLGIPANKKVILYSGGPVRLLPDEPQYLKALQEAFDFKKISKEYVVLFRCHPLDKVERWKKYVGESDNIIYDSAPNGAIKMDQVNVRDEDIMKLISTLMHTEIHINVVSTMCVDGSVFNKPQIGPFYDDIYPENQDLFRGMYQQEHYRPILRTKVLHLAHSKEEYIDLVIQTIKDPMSHISRCKPCVEEIITYTDGQSAKRAAQAIKQFFTA